MEKDLIASFGQLKVGWKDDYNRSRVLDTLIFIYNRITQKLGAAALDESLLVGRFGDKLLVPLRAYYGTISHTRKYKDVKSLVLGCLKNRFNLPTLSSAEKKAKDEIISSATRYFNSWHVVAIEEVVITKKKQNEEQPRPLTGYQKDVDVFVGLSKDELLALQAPVALEMLLEDPSKRAYLESQGFNLSESAMKDYRDESSNGISETSMLSDRYPTLAWFLFRAGYDGISKAYANAIDNGFDEKKADSVVRASLKDNIRQDGADSVLQRALEKAAASK